MKKQYYINGNVVRELEAQPVRKPERPISPERQRIEKEQEKKKIRRAARRNRELAQDMNWASVCFLSLCVIMVAVAAVSLIQMQSQVTQRMKHIAALESQINDLKADNDTRYKEITTSVDLEYIKDVAINQLGMKYATEDQIIYYKVDNNNFMEQYVDIPK